jgi:hypothetical protein
MRRSFIQRHEAGQYAPFWALLLGLWLGACGGVPEAGLAPADEPLGTQESASCVGLSVTNLTISGLSSYQGELAGSGSWAVSPGANGIRLEYYLDGVLVSAEEHLGTSGTWYFSGEMTCGTHTFQVKSFPMVVASNGGRSYCYSAVRSLSQSVTETCGVRGSGFAWIYTPSSTVSPSYSYNSSGGAVTYTRPTTGRYQVRFAGIGRPEGNAHVVAYGGTPERCRLESLGKDGTDMIIDVSCHQPGGALADSSFVVYYNSMQGLTYPGYPRGAYVLTSSGSGALALAGYQWNDTGNTNSVSHHSTGYYTVTLPGINFSNASVHVTAVGGSGAQHCKVLGWGAYSYASVDVACYDAAGNLADSAFSLSYWSYSQLSGHLGGHAWINGPTSVPAGYQQLIPEFECTSAGVVSVSKPATDYEVSFTRVYRATDSMVMVTGYGGGSNYCKVVNWYAGPDTARNQTLVNVRCFDKNGVPTTSSFDVTYTSKWMVGFC